MSVNKVHSEKLLVLALKKGNKEAFKKLFDAYRNDLYKFSLSMVFSEAYAEEIVQDVFMKVWLKREDLNIDLSFKSYLFTITKNKTINFLRKAANSKKLREEIFYRSQKLANPTESYIRETELETLKSKALDKLSPRRREIFEMSRNEGKSYEDIAVELNISISTVRNQMSKSLEILRIFFLKHKDVSLTLIFFYKDWL